MGNFRFRLNTVLELKKHLEQEQKDAFAKEKKRLDELEREKERLSGDLRQWSGNYLKSAEEGVSPSSLARVSGYIFELDALLTRNAAQIQKQNDAVERARLELVERMQDRKTLEKLKEKQRAAFLEEEDRTSRMETEDLISARSARA